jgi:hypothetical protein
MTIGPDRARNVSFTQSATDKILRDKHIFIDLRGEEVVPRISYFVGGHYYPNEGGMIELGPMLALSFIAPSEAQASHYMTVDLNGECIVLLDPAVHFRIGAHQIDWVDRKFKLTSTE